MEYDKIDILLFDNSKNVIEEKYIQKPKSFQDLKDFINKHFIKLPKKYNIVFQSNNNIIKINNNEDYQLVKDIIYIYGFDDMDDMYKSVFEINYNQLPEDKKEILDDKCSCSICSEIIKNENPYFCYTCQKLYHHKCLESWDKKRDINEILKCPNCREEMSLDKWKEKLDFEENRESVGRIMNIFNELKNDNNKKNLIIEQCNYFTEKISNLLNLILININKIHSLIQPKINERLLSLINNFSKSNINNNQFIDDISSVILEEFKLIENVINEKNQYIELINKKINENRIIDEKKNNNENYEKEIVNKYTKSNENIIEKKNGYIDDCNEKNNNEINLIYLSEKNEIANIFGNKFVENNKANIELIINGIKSILISQSNLKKGENYIQLIIKNKITDLSFMFEHCSALKSITGLKYLDTKDINNFCNFFSGCSSLTDITPLQNWNVANCNNFQYMFSGCQSLTDITPLQNWNVSNGKYFQSMFYDCSSLINIKPLKNWDVSNGLEFSFMFNDCISLTNLSALEKWDVSKCNNLQYMFCGCISLSDINGLKDWNVEKCKNFSYMFYGCSSLSDIKPLEKWNVSKCNDFSKMFYGCDHYLILNH